VSDTGPKIWIRLPVTAVVAGPNYEAAQEIEHSGFTICRGGNYDVVNVPPGVAFQIEEAEGRRLVARFNGEIVEGKP